MSRAIVTSIFLALTVPTAVGAVEQIGVALGEGSLNSWLIAGHWLLKAAVVSAFTLFVFARGPARRPSREVLAFTACAAAILATIALEPPGHSARTGFVLAGEAVALAGGAWTLYAVLNLGRCFGILPEARGLVTSGPYRFVRHPVYLGEFLMYGGLVLGAASVWNLAGAAVFVVAQIVRMRLEERALEREFPEYASYAARTPRVLPRLRFVPSPVPQRGEA